MDVKRINVILPEDLIEETLKNSKKNLTESIKDALDLYNRSKAYQYIASREGKVKIKNIPDLRED